MLARSSAIYQLSIHHSIKKQLEEHFIILYNDLCVINQHLTNLWFPNWLSETRNVKLFVFIIWYRGKGLQGITTIAQQIGALWRCGGNKHIKVIFGKYDTDGV